MTSLAGTVFECDFLSGFSSTNWSRDIHISGYDYDINYYDYAITMTLQYTYNTPCI